MYIYIYIYIFIATNQNVNSHVDKENVLILIYAIVQILYILEGFAMKIINSKGKKYLILLFQQLLLLF